MLLALVPPIKNERYLLQKHMIRRNKCHSLSTLPSSLCAFHSVLLLFKQSLSAPTEPSLQCRHFSSLPPNLASFSTLPSYLSISLLLHIFGPHHPSLVWLLTYHPWVLVSVITRGSRWGVGSCGCRICVFVDVTPSFATSTPPPLSLGGFNWIYLMHPLSPSSSVLVIF